MGFRFVGLKVSAMVSNMVGKLGLWGFRGLVELKTTQYTTYASSKTMLVAPW